MRKYILFVFITVTLLFGCEKDEATGPVIYSVKYEATGTTASVNITIENEQGGTSQYADINPTWDYSFTRSAGEFVYISAQNQTEYGSVTVTIYVDGDVWKTSSSNGAYVIASASGIL